MPLHVDDPSVLGDDARWRIERRLGQGAFGVVYAARDRKNNAPVAIKMLGGVSADARRELAREYELLKELRHPNVVELYGLGEDDGDSFLVMERVEGVDFVRFVRADVKREERSPRSLPMVFGLELADPGSTAFIAPTTAGVERLRAALPQIFAALAALHARGVVHRDVRPANLRVTPSGRVVLLDFGLATAGDLGALVGSPAYMAPEQFDGGQLAPESDWYAVGVVLFEALTGSLPFSGSAQEMFVRKRTVSAPRPSLLIDEVPADLDALTAALLEADPQRRRGAAARLIDQTAGEPS